jgi:hypothetical protein
MSSWDFRKEGTQVASGANTVAGMKAGYQPFYEAGNMASKRNVISTTQGWVRRVWKGARKQEEVLVAAAPGSGFYYTSNAYLHFPDIAQMYVKLNANGVISANVSSNLYVIFNSPIKVKASSNLIHLVVANTVGGNTANAHIVTQGAAGNTGIGANNTLIFTIAPLQGGTGSAKGTYQIAGQIIGGTGNPVYNPEINTICSANLTITGAVANNLLDGVGSRITTFQVSPNGV